MNARHSPTGRWSSRSTSRPQTRCPTLPPTKRGQQPDLERERARARTGRRAPGLEDEEREAVRGGGVDEEREDPGAETGHRADAVGRQAEPLAAGSSGSAAASLGMRPR